MDYEKLIERLEQYSEDLIAYKLGCNFADACTNAATALSALQAENEKLRAELEQAKEAQRRTFNEDAVLNLAGQALGVTPGRLRELAQADREERHA